MILIIDFNPIYEELIIVKNFAAGGTYHSDQIISMPGGAGIRIARAISHFGERAVVSGFIGGKLGQAMKLHLYKEDIPFNFIDIKDEVQRNEVIIDASNGRETHIIGQEATFSERELMQFKNLYKSLSGGMKAICFCGAATNTLPLDAFKDLIQTQRGKKTLHFVYGTCNMIRSTLRAKPFFSLMKQSDLESCRGVSFKNRSEIIAALRGTLPIGLGFVTVMENQDSIVLVSENSECYFEIPQTSRVMKKIGGEETLLAGIILGQLQFNDILKAIRLGMAARASTTEHLMIPQIDRQLIETLMASVDVRPCGLPQCP